MRQKSRFPHLFAKDKEGRGVGHVMVAKGTVDRGLMNEGIAPLGGEDLPFLLVVANVGIGAKRQQGDDHVQVVVWSNVVEHLGHQTFCG